MIDWNTDDRVIIGERFVRMNENDPTLLCYTKYGRSMPMADAIVNDHHIDDAVIHHVDVAAVRTMMDPHRHHPL